MVVCKTIEELNIFFDLDGTLLDCRERLFRLFQFLVPASNLSFETYWELKENHVKNGNILSSYFGYSEEDIVAFEKTWLMNVEQSEWLTLDKPFDGVTNYLFGLKDVHSMYLVTARQNEDSARRQIASLGWAGMFKGILVTGQKMDKSKLIRSTLTPHEKDWMVGDTISDILAGKQLGIRTAVVLSGYLTRQEAVRYEPDQIGDGVQNLVF